MLVNWVFMMVVSLLLGLQAGSQPTAVRVPARQRR